MKKFKRVKPKTKNTKDERGVIKGNITRTLTVADATVSEVAQSIEELLFIPE